MRAALLASAVVLALGACSSAPPDPLHSAGGDVKASAAGVGGFEAYPASRGASISLLVGVYVCATTKPVTVDAVTLHDPTPGFVVRDWGIGVRPSELGDAVGPLSKLGPFTGRRVTVRCRHDGHFAQIGVELARTTNQTGRALGYDVHYRSGGTEKTRWLNQAVALCTPSDFRRSEADPAGSQGEPNLCGDNFGSGN